MTGNVQLYLTDEGITRGGSYTGWGAHSRMGGMGQGIEVGVVTSARCASPLSIHGEDMKPPNNAWPNTDNGRAGLFLAQTMRETLDPRAFESFRLRVLDINSLASEVISLLEEANSKKISFATVNPARSELVSMLSKDTVLNRILGNKLTFSLSQLNKRSGEKAADIEYSINLIEQLKREIASNYIQELEEEILSRYKDTEAKSSIIKIIHDYLSILHNYGYSREYLSECVENTFFNKDFKRFTNATIKAFFRKFDFTPEKYEIFLPVSHGTTALINSLDFQPVRVLNSSELPTSARRELSGHRYFNEADSYAHSKMSRLDPYSSLQFTQKVLGSFASLSDLQWDGLDVRWKDHAFLNSGDHGNGKLISLEESRFTRIARGISGGRAKRIREQTAAVVAHFDSKSLERILQSTEYVSLAKKSDNYDNQIMLLWSAVEMLMGDPPNDSSRISHFIDHFVPTTCLDYQKRYVSAVFYMLRRFHRKSLGTALDAAGVPKDANEKNRFIRYLYDPRYATKHRELTGRVSSNQLAIYHLWQVWSKFKNPKKLVHSISEHENRVKWQIYRIYRTRNELVHGGSSQSYIRSLTLNAFEYYISSFYSIVDIAQSRGGKENNLSRIASEAAFLYEHFKSSANSLNLSKEDDLESFLSFFYTKPLGSS